MLQMCYAAVTAGLHCQILSNGQENISCCLWTNIFFLLLVGLRIQEYHQGPWSRALGLEVWILLGTVFKGLVENIGCFCLVLSQYK